MAELEAGSKVKYHTGDEKWKNGVIHGVRKVDDVDGVPRVLAYLIDTGRDDRLDVTKTNLKDVARSKKFTEHRARGVDRIEAMAKAEAHVENLPDEIVTDTFRQPEQIDVRPENVKSR